MARAASRKSSGRASRKVSAHRACVSRQAKRMHKTATRTRSHQLALARANKACAKKTTRKTRSRKASGSRKGKKMHGMMDRMKAGYQNMKTKAKQAVA
jgi:hypothetical protein